jgi:hypothetical protein
MVVIIALEMFLTVIPLVVVTDVHLILYGAWWWDLYLRAHPSVFPVFPPYCFHIVFEYSCSDPLGGSNRGGRSSSRFLDEGRIIEVYWMVNAYLTLDEKKKKKKENSEIKYEMQHTAYGSWKILVLFHQYPPIFWITFLQGNYMSSGGKCSNKTKVDDTQDAFESLQSDSD